MTDDIAKLQDVVLNNYEAFFSLKISQKPHHSSSKRDPDGKRDLDSFSAEGFFLPPREVFLSFEEASQFLGIGAIGK